MSAGAELPFLPFHRPSVDQAEIDAVVDTLRSGWLTMGPKTRAFEEQFAEAVTAPHGVAVSSATAGLHLGLDALGIGAGDEVLVPTLTFASTGATVIHAGARPVLVDCEPDTLNLDVADAARKWTSRTKAIVPVHFAGHPCDMTAVLELAQSHGVPVMEDAAHALPARYRGRMVGNIGRLTVFSFYATKNLTTGEGGMVTSADDALVERIRARRLHGMTRDAWKRYSKEGSWRYDVAYPGFKYNMTDMNAALGLVQLQRLPAMQAERRRIVEQYRTALADVDALELPTCRPEVEHAWHLFVVRVRAERLRIGRDEVIQELTAAGIGTSVHFIPLHEHSYYRDVVGVRAEDLPVAHAQWQRTISLPLYPGLRAVDVERVAETLRGIVRRHRR
ncbi:MAG: DegT/DnrJ/EryC1/StrS family aminotransferase [Candidatus Binatia bacterium]